MILFTGDLFLGKEDNINSNEVKKIITNNRYIFTNLESVVSKGSLSKRKDKNSILEFNETNLRNYLSHIDAEQILSLGNNHIHDLGEEGLENTKDILSKYDVKYFGVDYLLKVISPFILKIKNIKIAFLCVSTEEPEVTSICASENHQGVLDYNDCRIKNIIQKTKKKVDFFIIFPHWGREFLDYPSVQLRYKAYNWIDAGADLIIGNHPHIIQGKESYKGKWIYYSLGNYIFPDFFKKNGVKKSWGKSNSHSVMLKIDFDKNIVINEIGLFYDTKTNELKLNRKSIDILNYKSESLNILSVPIKRYFSLWEKNYLQKILYQDTHTHNIINKFFPRHRDHSRIVYFFLRLIKKIKGDNGFNKS